MPRCDPCGRQFSDGKALHQHFQDSKYHSYCSRCDSSFISDARQEKHIKTSPRHNICGLCSETHDFDSRIGLKKHAKEVHTYCSECKEGFQSPAALRSHDIDKHHVCEECEEYFKDSANHWLVSTKHAASEVILLSNTQTKHQNVHQPRKLKCYGCPRTFGLHSTLLHHLESRECDSRSDRDLVDDVALGCDMSSVYSLDGPEYFFFCPTCEKRCFDKMSGLFQHIESKPCNERIRDSPSLNKFLGDLKSRIHNSAK